MSQRQQHSSADAAPRPRILCLHGSRQDGEVFSQRLRLLCRKLAGVADLHFVSAPHELPFSEGQSVAMRAWWRHWNLPQPELYDTIDPAVHNEPDEDDVEDSDPGLDSNSGLGSHPRLGAASRAAGGSGKANAAGPRQLGAAAGAGAAAAAGDAAGAATSAPAPAGGWDEQIVRDWDASLQALASEWRASGPFEGLLGFSNGAAAALLLACHAVADPSTFPGLRFVILAGGYVPQPLHRLAPPGTATPPSAPNDTDSDGGGGGGGGGSRLTHPLLLPSLHFYSETDAAVPYDDSLELAECFRPEDRTAVEHTLGHCLPQKAPHTAAVVQFVRRVASGAGGGDGEGEGGRGGRRGGGAGRRGRGGGGLRHTAEDPVAAALAGIAGLTPPSGPPAPPRAAGGQAATAAAAAAAVGSPRGPNSNQPPQPPQQPQQQPHYAHPQSQRPAQQGGQQSWQVEDRGRHTPAPASGAAPASGSGLALGSLQQSGSSSLARTSRAPLVVGRGPAAVGAPAAGGAAAVGGGGAGGGGKGRVGGGGTAGSGCAGGAERAQAGATEGSAAKAQQPAAGSSKAVAAATTAGAATAAGGATRGGGIGSTPAAATAASKPAPTAAQAVAPAAGPAAAAAAAAKAPTAPAPAAKAAASPAAAAAPSVAPPSVGVVAVVAASAEAVEAVEASEEQREEMDALEAIFMEEYRPISTAPPRFTIHLREPGAGEGEGAGAEGPPSRLFSLTFTLPRDYPASLPPLVAITGPLGGNDPRRHALATHIVATAREAVEGSGAGCVFQVVEAAREWIDANLPPDVGERRESHHPSGGAAAPHHHVNAAAPVAATPAAAAGAATPPPPSAAAAGGSRAPAALTPAAAAAALAAAAAGPGVMNLGWGASALGNATASGAAGADQWWLREEADPELIRAAVAEAAASAPWRTGRAEALALAEGDADAAEALQWGEGDAGPAAPGSGPDASLSAAAAEWSQRGRWDYVVGLVGKPSAGKSTFFNAVTDPASDEEGARVAAFPFTTIAPNVGRGYCLVPDPAPLLGLRPGQCRPLHGHVEAFNLDAAAADPRVANVDPLRRWVGAAGWAAPGRPLLWRRVPVVLKDVAGLVPGAYQGRGRGNAFLNDLCDADVLIHVVDASGTTDREGQLLDGPEEGEGEGEGAGPERGPGAAGAAGNGRGGGGGRGGDPLDDVGWVREELHRWVYDNVRAKWSFVLRKPARLPELFSGYHASRALVAEVLARVGVSVGSLVVEGASLAHWTEAHLHRLVAHFLQARFPILLALNKADMSSSSEHILRVRQALPYDPAVPVSAATERWLCAQRRAGRVSYSDAGADVSTATDSSELAQQLARVKSAVLGRYGSTGAALALTCAVAMRPPSAVFPVSDLESYSGLAARGIASGAGGLLGSGLDAKARAAEGSHPGVLRDCVLLKPGSHIVDLFEVLKRPPYQLLEGDFIRAECSALTAQEAAAASAAAAAAGTAAAADTNADAGGSGGGCSGDHHPPSHSHPHPHPHPHPQPQTHHHVPQPHPGFPIHQTWRVLKKDEVLDWGSCVARIMTNRRSHWQAPKR